MRGETDLIDFSTPSVVTAAPGGGPALVPTDKGVARAGKLEGSGDGGGGGGSGLEDMQDLQRAMLKGKTPSLGESDDDFVDC